MRYDLVYVTKQAYLLLKGAPWAYAAMLFSAVLGLSVVCLSIILLENLQEKMADWKDADRIFCLLEADLSAEQQQRLIHHLEQLPFVASATTASAQSLLEDLEKEDPSLSFVLHEEMWLLPQSLILTLHPQARNLLARQQLRQHLDEMFEIQYIEDGQQTMRQWQASRQLLQWLGYGFSAGLWFVLLWFVASGMRLQMAWYQEDIAILQLLGAPTTVILGPFVLLALSIGGVAGLLVDILALMLSFAGQWGSVQAWFSLFKIPSGCFFYAWSPLLGIVLLPSLVYGSLWDLLRHDPL